MRYNYIKQSRFALRFGIVYTVLCRSFFSLFFFSFFWINLYFLKKMEFNHKYKLRMKK